MISDYGKMAYVKVIELENKLERKLKELEKSVYKSLFFDLATSETHATFTRSFKFKANADCAVKCTLTIGAIETATVNYSVTVMDKVIKSGVAKGLETLLSFDFCAYEGENDVTIELVSNVPYLLDNLKVVLGGNVDYFPSKNRLSSVSYGSKDYVTFLSGNGYVLYEYDGTRLKTLYESHEVLDACIGGMVGEELYVITISLNHGLQVMMYNVNTGFGVNTTPLINSVTSVCAYPYDNGVRIIFVKTGAVYNGFYRKGGSFSCESMGRRASLVFADANVLGACVLTDEFKPSKLIVNGISTFVIEKGENYHVNKVDGGYKLTFSRENKGYSQTVLNLTKKPELLGFCDEQIELVDGKILKRVRESLTIANKE